MNDDQLNLIAQAIDKHTALPFRVLCAIVDDVAQVVEAMNATPSGDLPAPSPQVIQAGDSVAPQWSEDRRIDEVTPAGPGRVILGTAVSPIGDQLTPIGGRVVVIPSGDQDLTTEGTEGTEDD